MPMSESDRLTEIQPAEAVRQNEHGDWVCVHGTAMDVHCCNCHSGFVFDLAHECPNEELTPHTFNSRTPYEPGDDRDIWCKDCEYHRDDQIHKEAAGHD